MSPLVEYRGFRAAFGGGAEVVHGIDFSIEEHETFALVGESGSGKTVTAQALMRLLGEDRISYQGEVFFAGADVLRMQERELLSLRGKEIGMIFQEPMTSLNPLHTVEKQLGESLALHQGIAPRKARPLILEWLQRVGLADAERRLSAYPHELSGGERQRVMIALALLNRPRLLIADEPTTALDVTIQDQILTLIRELQKELGMAALFITHDLDLVRRMAARTAVMRDGLILESGATEDLFAAPREEYTRLLVAADASRESPPADPAAPVLAEGLGIRVYFPVRRGFFRRVTGHVKAVDGVDFVLRRGQTLGIVWRAAAARPPWGRRSWGLSGSSPEGALSASKAGKSRGWTKRACGP